MPDVILELISTVPTQNEVGDVIDDKSYTEVFGKEKSIKQSEFYQAQASGFKPELKFEINSFEYNNEKYVRYNNKEYRVIRTYKVSLDKIEITLEGDING